MEKILVPFGLEDKASENAINHAAEIAGKSGAEIILYHAFMPVSAPPLPYIQTFVNELKAVSREKLKSYVEKLKTLYPKIRFRLRSSVSYIHPGLSAIVNKVKPDLSILGLHKRSAVEELLLGSTSLELFLNTHSRVLAIPQSARSAPIKKIMFAANAGELDEVDYSMITEFQKLFNAKLLLLSVVDRKTPASEKETVKERLNEQFKLSNPEILVKTSRDIIREIKKTIREEAPSILVMSPGEKSLWRLLFNDSNSRAILKNSKIPVLMVPYKK
jgi:nucleotide-binding universal stress UspA family protein